jgi:hypothetical protein
MRSWPRSSSAGSAARCSRRRRVRPVRLSADRARLRAQGLEDLDRTLRPSP